LQAFDFHQAPAASAPRFRCRYPCVFHRSCGACCPCGTFLTSRDVPFYRRSRALSDLRPIFSRAQTNSARRWTIFEPESGSLRHDRQSRKGVLPPESAAPTSPSSIDTALPLDRSSSYCVRALRAQALLERHGLGRLVVAEAHDMIVAGQRLTEEAVLDTVSHATLTPRPSASSAAAPAGSNSAIRPIAYEGVRESTSAIMRLGPGAGALTAGPRQRDP
jgi:hypothetical protein